jgi:Chlorophyll A-B binding protein
MPDMRFAGKPPSMTQSISSIRCFYASGRVVNCCCGPARASLACTFLTSHVICFADVKTLPGISAPFENIFDPADLIGRADGSVRPVQEIKRWREAEITHGRVAMLAAVGFVVGEQLEVGVRQSNMASCDQLQQELWK